MTRNGKNKRTQKTFKNSQKNPSEFIFRTILLKTGKFLKNCPKKFLEKISVEIP